VSFFLKDKLFTPYPLAGRRLAAPPKNLTSALGFSGFNIRLFGPRYFVPPTLTVLLPDLGVLE